jgi:hypothetical protein
VQWLIFYIRGIMANSLLADAVIRSSPAKHVLEEE